MNEENENIGPERITFTSFLLRFMAGTAGGVLGGVVLLLLFLLASSVFEPLAALGEQIAYISPIFTFVILIIIFLSTTAGNIAGIWLMGLAEQERYKKLSSAIYQIFVISLIIFICMAPIYFITGATDPTITAYVVAIHIILTAQVSALVLEIISNNRYALVGVYGVTFSVLISAGAMFSIAGFITNPQILLFIALPVVWASMALVGGLVNNIYVWLAKTYDKDFLAADTVYGDDYGKEVEEKEEPKAKDEEGADFLRKN